LARDLIKLAASSSPIKSHATAFSSAAANRSSAANAFAAELLLARIARAETVVMMAHGQMPELIPALGIAVFGRPATVSCTRR
jgi:hypothetical protein